MSLHYAGKPCTIEQVRSTIRLLKYYNGFLKSDCEHCCNPESQWGDRLTKEQARRRVGFLVNSAINRKAGIPDVACRKQDPEYQIRLYRDCRKVRDNVNRRHIVHQFETAEINRRYKHLLWDEEDD